MTPVPPTVPTAPHERCPSFQALVELRTPSLMPYMKSWITPWTRSTRRCPVAQVGAAPWAWQLSQKSGRLCPTAPPGPGVVAPAGSCGVGVSLLPPGPCCPQCQLQPPPNPVLPPPGSLSQGSGTKLPYYTGDGVEESDPKVASGRDTGTGTWWGAPGRGDMARCWGHEGTQPLFTQVSPAQLWLSLVSLVSLTIAGALAEILQPRCHQDIPSGVARGGWHSQTPAPASGSPRPPVPVAESPAQHSSPDVYDDAAAVPEVSPAPSAGDNSEGVAQRSWGCPPPTGKRGQGCPVPWRATSGDWLWARNRQQIHGGCGRDTKQLPQSTSLCPLRWELPPLKSCRSHGGPPGTAPREHRL